MSICSGIFAVGVESRRDMIAMLRRDRPQMVHRGDHHLSIQIPTMIWSAVSEARWDGCLLTWRWFNLVDHDQCLTPWHWARGSDLLSWARIVRVEFQYFCDDGRRGVIDFLQTIVMSWEECFLLYQSKFFPALGDIFHVTRQCRPCCLLLIP